MNKNQTVYLYLFNLFWKEAKHLEDQDICSITKKSILTVNTPIYAAIVYFETNSMSKAFHCHNLVLDGTRYVLSLNDYHKTRIDKYLTQADNFHNILLEKLNSKQRKKILDLEKKLFPFWDLKKTLQKKMKKNENIDIQEIEEYTVKKSTDVFAYSMISSFISFFPKEVTTELYKQQLLRDFEDDYTDLKEDADQNISNPFLMRLYKRNFFSFDNKYSQKQLEELVKSEVYNEHKQYLKLYCKPLDDISTKYQWIKECKIPNVK